MKRYHKVKDKARDATVKSKTASVNKLISQAETKTQENKFIDASRGVADVDELYPKRS